MSPRERKVRFGQDEVHELQDDAGRAGRMPWYTRMSAEETIDDVVDLDDDDNAEDDDGGRGHGVVQIGEEDSEKYEETGERMEPFNLRSERANDGFFDGAGNFVWRKEAREPDAWVAEMAEDEALEEAAIGQAAARRRQKNGQDRESTDADLRKLLVLMLRGETLAQCLKRLGRTLPASRHDFDAVTAIGDALLASGRFDAFEQVRESLLPSDSRQWEYTADDGKVYGPFDTNTILEWRHQGYFRHETPMRIIQKPKSASAADDFLADFENDDEEDEIPPSKKKFKLEANEWTPAHAIDFATLGWPFHSLAPSRKVHLNDDSEDDEDDLYTSAGGEQTPSSRRHQRNALQDEKDDDDD